MLYIDNRWRGHHGIARFSSQVIPRISSTHQKIGGAKPLGLRALLGGLAIGRNSRVYTPGFNATLTRAPQLLTIHDLIHLQLTDETSKAKGLYYEKVVKPSILRSGVVHTVSDYSKSQIEAWLGSRNVSVINVGNGVSDVFFRDAHASLEPGRASGPRFVYVGNLKSHKNASVIFAALRLRPDYSVDFVSSNRDEVIKQASAYGVEVQVGLISAISDSELAGLYEESAGLLFPSKMEGFGLPPLEALMAGSSVAYSSECAAVAEVVGQAGYAVDDAGSPVDWARAMDDLIGRMPVLTPAFRDNLRRKYSWSSVGERVQESLREWIDS